MIYTDIDVALPGDVAQNAELIKAYLQAKFPGCDLTKGSPMYDLLVRPTAQLGSLLNTNALLMRSSCSLGALENYPALNSVADIDSLLSNYFTTRSAGTIATGFVTLTFSSNRTVSIPEGTAFTFGSVTFYSYSAVVGVASTAVTQYDAVFGGTVGAYTLTVPVATAVAGAAGNLPAGTGVEVSAEFTGLVSAVIAGDILDGTDAESVADALDRVKTTLPARTLNSQASITALLTASFPGIRVGVIGMGSPSMTRDISPVLGMSVGGKCDIYVSPKTPVEDYTYTATATVTASQQWEIIIDRSTFSGALGVTVKRANGTVIPESRVERTPTATGVHTINTDAEGHGSAFMTGRVSFTDTQTDPRLAIGSTSSYVVTIRRVPAVEAIQIMADMSSIRNTRYDDLIKGAIVVDVSAVIHVVLPSTATATVAAIQTAVASTINGLPMTNELSTAVVAEAVQSVLPVGAFVRMPIDLRGSFYDPADMAATSIRSSSTLTVPAMGVGIESGMVRMYATQSAINVAVSYK